MTGNWLTQHLLGLWFHKSHWSKHTPLPPIQWPPSPRLAGLRISHTWCVARGNSREARMAWWPRIGQFHLQDSFRSEPPQVWEARTPGLQKSPRVPAQGPPASRFCSWAQEKQSVPTLQTKPGWVGSLPPQSKAPSVASGVLGRGPGTPGHINVNKPHSPRFQLVCDHTHTRKQISAHDCQKTVPTDTGPRTGVVIS